MMRRRTKRCMTEVAVVLVVSWFALFGFVVLAGVVLAGVVDGVQAVRAGQAINTCRARGGESLRKAFQHDIACAVASLSEAE